MLIQAGFESFKKKKAALSKSEMSLIYKDLRINLLNLHAYRQFQPI
jgi:hypothetical protein